MIGQKYGFISKDRSLSAVERLKEMKQNALNSRGLSVAKVNMMTQTIPEWDVLSEGQIV